MDERKSSNESNSSELEATNFSSKTDFFERYNYKMIQVIGRGMSGEVVLAQRGIGSRSQMKAVKRCYKNDSDAEGIKERFVTEVCILQGVKHRYIMSDVKVSM